jgi:hypothetical protein
LTRINDQKVHIAVRHFLNAKHPDAILISMDGKLSQVASSDAMGNLRFADRPEDAPIVCLDGPLHMALQQKTVLKRGSSQELMGVVGTEGLGAGSFAAIALTRAPSDAHPVAEIAFDNKNKGAPPIRVRVALNQRC